MCARGLGFPPSARFSCFVRLARFHNCASRVHSGHILRHLGDTCSRPYYFCCRQQKYKIPARQDTELKPVASKNPYCPGALLLRLTFCPPLHLGSPNYLGQTKHAKIFLSLKIVYFLFFKVLFLNFRKYLIFNVFSPLSCHYVKAV